MMVTIIPFQSLLGNIDWKPYHSTHRATLASLRKLSLQSLMENHKRVQPDFLNVFYNRVNAK